MSSEQSDLAIATMENGIGATGGSSLRLTGLVTYVFCTGKLDFAIKQYRKLLVGTPGSTLAANNLAMLLIECKDGDASRAEAHELVRTLANSNNTAYLDT